MLCPFNQPETDHYAYLHVVDVGFDAALKFTESFVIGSKQ